MTARRLLMFSAAVIVAASAAQAGVDAGTNGYNVVTRVLSGTKEDFTFNVTASGQMITVDIDHQAIGGSEDFCLQVLNSTGTVLCWADDTMTGGASGIASLDPALTCVLPATGTHRVRVALFDGDCSDTNYGTPGDAGSFYHLNSYFSNQATPGGQLGAAGVQSRNMLSTP